MRYIFAGWLSVSFSLLYAKVTYLLSISWLVVLMPTILVLSPFALLISLGAFFVLAVVVAIIWFLMWLPLMYAMGRLYIKVYPNGSN
jgi:hypothetical protein